MIVQAYIHLNYSQSLLKVLLRFTIPFGRLEYDFRNEYNLIRLLFLYTTYLFKSYCILVKSQFNAVRGTLLNSVKFLRLNCYWIIFPLRRKVYTVHWLVCLVVAGDTQICAPCTIMMVPNNFSLPEIIVELRSQSGPRFDLNFLEIIALKVILAKNLTGFPHSTVPVFSHRRNRKRLL